MKRYLLAFPVVLVMILASCQKEGCTDRNSLNYDPDANSDDGSCCQEVLADTSVSYPIYENDPNSPYYQELIAAITVKRKVFTYSGASC